MEFRDYFLIFVCFAAAAIFFFKFAKEKKVFISAGFLCLFYGGYNTAKALLEEGSTVLTVYSWLLRGFAVLVLIWMFLVLRDEKASGAGAQEKEEAPVEAQNVSGENYSESVTDDDAEE